jgi:hypothetical protein
MAAVAGKEGALTTPTNELVPWFFARLFEIKEIREEQIEKLDHGVIGDCEFRHRRIHPEPSFSAVDPNPKSP